MSILKLLSFFAIALNPIISCTQKIENIIIRHPVKSDLESIIDVDTRISFEHFKPIYTNYYAHLWIGQNTDKFLERAIKEDIEIFNKLFEDPNNPQRVLIAYDNSKQICVGFIIFHRDMQRIIIDLIMIEKEYRGFGIGKELIQKALITFDNISLCTVYVFKYGNEGAKKFYESLGFINIGEPPIDSMGDGFKHRDLHYLYQLKLR